MITSLFLRLLTVILVATSIFIILTNKIKFSDGENVSFKDFIGYRYVLATSIIGALYNLLLIPFELHYACTGKRIVRSEYMLDFIMYSDMHVLLATGVGAGFAVSIDMRRLVHDIPANAVTAETVSKLDKFFKRGKISTGLMFLRLLCTVVISVVSNIIRTKSRERRMRLFG